MKLFASGFFSEQNWWIAAVLLSFLCGSIVAIFSFTSGGTPPSNPTEDPVSFNEDIRPIFNEQCVDCHGGVTQKGDVNVIFRENLLDEGASGNPAVVPGKPEKSELMARVTHEDPEKRMPYKKKPLSKEEISDLRRWIENGAKWKKHWAYQKLSDRDPPEVTNTSWPRNGIDQFVLHRLKQKDLTPSDRAECHTLIRRLSLDLRGLPPSEEDVRMYRKNPTPDTYEQLVDKYLNSSDFGERWATMWLDLARYADSVGYDTDELRTIWKFRDWVIRAFNEDKPFDEFTIEQLAGDLLEDPSKDQLLATAYHRNTKMNTEGGTSDEEYRVNAVISRVNNTMEAWQGVNMGCVQCHSHPYEPIKHKEYYRFYAFFNQTKDRDIDSQTPSIPGLRPDYPQYPFLNDSEQQKKAAKLYQQIESLRKRMDQKVKKKKHQKKLQEWVKKARRQLGKSEGRADSVKAISPKSPLEEIIHMPKAERTPNEQWQLERHYTHHASAFQDLKKKINQKKKELSNLDPVMIPIMAEHREDIQRETRKFNRGNWQDKGERVSAGVPEIFNDFPDDAPKNRLGLAKWLVSPDNPLTARVMVNRFWSKLFGRGIVKTTGNFTSRGSEPTHPALLNWLAHEFIHTHDWSVKSLLKQIVMSATYRQSSVIPDGLQERDPENKWLARGPRFRLSAEQIRDQALAVGGVLSDKMYGPPVMPPQPDGFWDGINKSWKTDTDEDRFRRGVYVFRRRNRAYPSFVAFDAPTRQNMCSRRIRTNSPTQALVTLNDPAFMEAARGLAGRMKKAGSTTRERIRRGYEMALFHEPPEEIMNELMTLHKKALNHYQSNKKHAKQLTGIGVMEQDGPKTAALTFVANTIMNIDSFLNKE